MTHAKKTLADMAQLWEDEGYPTLPVELKRDVITKKKNPIYLRKWGDPEVYQEPLAERFTRANAIGINCEHARIVVLDLDVKDGKNGITWWESFEGKQDTPLVIRTQSGGLQLYFADPDREFRNTQDAVSGVDIRGCGGMVFAPPSAVKGEGVAYRLEGQMVSAADLPQPQGVFRSWLLSNAGGRGSATLDLSADVEIRTLTDDPEEMSRAIQKIEDKLTELESLPPGSRNTQRFSIYSTVFRYAQRAFYSYEELAHRLLKSTPGGDTDAVILRDIERAAKLINSSDQQKQEEESKAVEVLQKEISIPTTNLPETTGKFFSSDRETGHRPTDIAAAASQNMSLVMAPGEQWLRHQDGLWMNDAEDVLHQRVISLLGPRYRGGVWKDTRAILQSIHTRKVHDSEIDREYINCPNGLLDLRTEALVPHSAEVLNFNQIAVNWNPAADCPEFDKWALEVFKDEDNVQLAWEIIGYCLYNDLPIQKAIVLIHGEGAPSGRNGKGSYLRIIESLLGIHNITAVPPQAFGEDRWAAASLYGKLANLAGDVSPQPFKDAATFKSLTGQDMVRADVKYREPIMFRNRATILASFNELPSSADRSKGFLERWVALPFFGNFSDQRADPEVVDRIVARELEGILVKAVRALRELLKKGHFGASRASGDAMREFKLNVDSVRRFLSELHEEPEIAGPATGKPPWQCSDLYAAYKGWCEDQGYRPLGRNKFIAGVESATDSPFGPLVKTRRTAGMTLIPVEDGQKLHPEEGQNSPF